MTATADEGAFVFDNRMAGYGAEPTRERPSDDACERRFMVAELSRMWIGCENNQRVARSAPQIHFRRLRPTGSVQENSGRDSMAVRRRRRKGIDRLFRAAAFWLAEPSR
jgi:hypothetical protein